MSVSVVRWVITKMDFSYNLSMIHWIISVLTRLVLAFGLLYEM